MDDYLKLTWSLHMNNFKDVIKDLQETECLSDVTLVCNDDTKIKAHKFVLIGSSSVLRTMLLESSQRETVVYLRGVDRRELEWLLEFMYLGETSDGGCLLNPCCSAMLGMNICILMRLGAESAEGYLLSSCGIAMLDMNVFTLMHLENLLERFVSTLVARQCST